MDIERILFEQLNDDDIKAERKEKQSERVDVGEQETVGQPAQLGKQKAAFIRFCHALLCFFDGGAASVSRKRPDFGHNQRGRESLRQSVI